MVYNIEMLLNILKMVVCRRMLYQHYEFENNSQFQQSYSENDATILNAIN